MECQCLVLLSRFLFPAQSAAVLQHTNFIIFFLLGFVKALINFHSKNWTNCKCRSLCGIVIYLI